MSQKDIVIAGRAIGPEHPPFVIAEISANHSGSIDRALEIMEAAKEAGADAVKLQTYTPDTMTIDCDRPEFQITKGLWKGRQLYELYQEAHTPWDWHPALFQRGAELGLPVFSTPFDETAVDFLESLDAPAYKIASFEATHLPLIERVAQLGKPMIVSTGMANEAEISEAVAAARDNGCDELLLLHCVSGYPTPPEEMNLQTIKALASRFDVQVGLSDHTLGTAVAVAAVALGATTIEKHVTLRRADGGPDAEFSLEPEELRRLVQDVRVAWSALGRESFAQSESERPNIKFRRSVFAVEDIAEGEAFTARNVRIIRPGYGLPPKLFKDVLGRKASRNIPRGTPLSNVDLS